MNHQPTMDRLIVEIEPKQNESDGGITLSPEMVRHQNNAKVLAVGPGRYMQSGQNIGMPFKVGDRIAFLEGAARIVEVDGVKFSMLVENDVIAVLK